jgi:hypothetical protein
MVIDPPRFNLLSGLVPRDEHLRVQALVSNAPVDTLHHRMLDGFPGRMTSSVTPCSWASGVERLGRQFAPMVHGDPLRVARPFRDALSGRHDRRPGERQIRFDSLTVATPVLHDRPRATPSAIPSRISHTIPTPSRIPLARARWHDPQMPRPRSTAREPHGQPCFPVDPVPSLPIHPQPARRSLTGRRREPTRGRAWASSRSRMRIAGSSCPWCRSYPDARFTLSRPHARRTPIANEAVTVHTSARVRVGFRPFLRGPPAE